MIILIASIFPYISCLEKVMALETIYIRANGSVEPYYAPIQRSGDVYTLTSDINSDIDGIVIERNDTVLNGAGHRLQGMNVQFSKGIYLSGDSNVTIRNITITLFENGILLDAYSVNNLIVDNRLEGNDYGVSCWAFSDNNTIVGNNITANNLAALWIVGSSNDTVTNNCIMNNNQYGIILESSYNGTICHNNFIGNTNQVNIYDSTGTWDKGYPSGGNYWSDYAGTDIHSGPDQNQPGSDGIGDTPYNCSENNQDRYPIMQVFTNVAIQGARPVKTVAGQGYNATIAIQVENQGWETRTTNVEMTLDTTTILTLNGLVMTGKNRTILTYTWQTSGYSIGNFTVSATATTVPGETDTTDNNCTWIVHVGVPGDVSSSTQGVYDKKCDMKDIAYLVMLFNTKPTSPNWNPNADVDNNSVVNMKDIAIAVAYFNQHE
jgi:parallel beta-helix repeat protein